MPSSKSLKALDEERPSFEFDAYLSHSSRDKERVLNIAERLRNDGVRVWIDAWSVKPGEDFYASLQDGLEKAMVLVVFLSKESVKSEWVKKEISALLFKDPSSKERRLIPVLLEDCEIPPMLRSIKYLDFRNNNEGAYDELRRLCLPVLTKRSSTPSADEAIEQIISQFNVSSEVQNVLAVAVELTKAQNLTELNTLSLMYGMAEAGRRSPSQAKTPQFFWEALGKPDKSRLKAVMNDSPEKVIVAISSNALKVFRLGKKLSTGMNSKSIHARHLFAALLLYSTDTSDYGAQIMVEEFGLSLTAIRERFYRFIIGVFPEEAKSWREILMDSKEFFQKPDNIAAKLPVKTPRKRREPTKRDNKAQQNIQSEYATGLLAGYQSDATHGPDLLGIQQEAEALASLVAAWTAEPPMAIGLFGEWGSGKTFFMRKMMDRVARLSKQARESGRRQRELGYYKNIVQIEFNAWHYMEGNLWASLVEHIFSRLLLYEDEPKAVVQARQRELLSKLETEQELKARAEKKKASLQMQKDAAEEKAKQLGTQINDSSLVLDRAKQDFWQRLRHTVGTDGEAMLVRIGLSNDSVKSAQELFEAVDELRTLTGRLKQSLQLLREKPDIVKILLWTTAAALIAWALQYFQGQLRLTDFPRFIGQFLMGGVALWRCAQPYLKKIDEGVAVVEDKRKQIAEEENIRRRDVEQKEREIVALTQMQKQAEQEATQAQARIEALEKDIQNTTASRLLGEFIEDRAKSDDYRKLLGVLAVIRRDFEKIADLFQEQRMAEIAGVEHQDDKTVNRIVLYIDDLDRCPPDQVVKVLQAIHLLLAFPMFVVVVGVDSRWISQSLENRFNWLAEDEREDVSGSSVPNRDVRSSATAHDYLEKIFQIPLWLKPMSADSCKSLLDGLTSMMQQKAPLASQHSSVNPHSPLSAPTPAITNQTPENVPAGPFPAPLEHSPKLGSVESAGSNVLQPSQSAQRSISSISDIDLSPKNLELEEKEIVAMKELVILIGRSPRAVKRFLNCYRLIKVGLSEKDFDLFFGASQRYKDVLTLLAVVTGAPSICEELFDLLRSRPLERLHSKSFALASDQPPPPLDMSVLKTIRDKADATTKEDWQRVIGVLEKRGMELNVKALKDSVCFVERYSFRRRSYNPHS